MAQSATPVREGGRQNRLTPWHDFGFLLVWGVSKKRIKASKNSPRLLKFLGDRGKPGELSGSAGTAVGDCQRWPALASLLIRNPKSLDP